MADGPHPLSDTVARKASRYLAVIDNVLAMAYLRPDLRRRVVRLQQQLIRAETNAHYVPSREDLEGDG